MAKAVGIPQNSYCLVAKVRAPLLDSTVATSPGWLPADGKVAVKAKSVLSG